MPRDKQYTPEEIEQKFEEYREMCTEYVKEVGTNSGKVLKVKTPRVMSIEGFCRFIRINRRTLSNYREAVGYEAYFPIIKDIDDEIYQSKVDSLLNAEGSTSAIIFNMKVKHGWKEESTINQNIQGGGIVWEIIDSRDKVEKDE